MKGVEKMVKKYIEKPLWILSKNEAENEAKNERLIKLLVYFF